MSETLRRRPWYRHALAWAGAEGAQVGMAVCHAAHREWSGVLTSIVLLGVCFALHAALADD